ncbi:hypothetical protein Taro_044990, partial [Colocasia esculenta]|nr:hypothetical protein [Colocasia esculenta]
LALPIVEQSWARPNSPISQRSKQLRAHFRPGSAHPSLPPRRRARRRNRRFARLHLKRSVDSSASAQLRSDGFSLSSSDPSIQAPQGGPGRSWRRSREEVSRRRLCTRSRSPFDFRMDGQVLLASILKLDFFEDFNVFTTRKTLFKLGPYGCRWKEMLQKGLNAVDVITFDYPYISGGKRKAPPKAEKLVDYHLNVVKEAAARHTGHPLVLAGKSMGSRVSCMVAGVKDIHVDGIICLGYPLKGTNGVVRDETLLQLTVPTMFVQGSKDTLCPLDKLEATRQKMKASNELYVIDGGDHSFKIGKRLLEATGLNQAEAEEKAVDAIAKFVSTCIRGSSLTFE